MPFMNWLVGTACLVSITVSSSFYISHGCSEDSCREVSAKSGQDVSLVCSSDCLTFPAWCTRHHDGFALPEDKLFSVSWYRNETPITHGNPDCNFTSCHSYIFELEGRSLVLANVTPGMSGSYKCFINFWYNSSCCQDLPNFGNVSVQQVCVKSFVGYKGLFDVSIRAHRGQQFEWSYHQPVYPWVVSSIIFGTQESSPLVSAMGLSLSEHRNYNPFKFSHWKHGHSSLWYVYGPHRTDRVLKIFKILQRGEDATFSCLPDCGYPMPEHVVWRFSQPGSSTVSDVDDFRSSNMSFLQRRWHLYLDNVSNSFAFTKLTCELDNGFHQMQRFPTESSIGAVTAQYFIDVNDTSEESMFSWGPSVPDVSHVVEYIQRGKKPKLCTEVLHNPIHGRLYVACYEMETKCTPVCKDYKTLNWTLVNSEEHVTSTLMSYKFCWKPFRGLTKNCSFVWETYQLRNPWKVLHHFIDFYVLDSASPTPSTVTPSQTGPFIAAACSVALFGVCSSCVILKVYRYCKRKHGLSARRLSQCDSNPMYGQMGNDSAMGSPRSAASAFSILEGLGSRERSLSQSPSTDIEMHSYIIPCDEWEVSREKIIRERVIGAGEFGEVFHGTLVQNDGVVQVAIKMTKEDASSKEVSDLKSELKHLKEISSTGGHANVIKLIGSCTIGEPLMVLTEYAEHGDLKNYLMHNRMKHSDTPKYERDMLFIQYCTDIAAGMEYLSAKKIVHRDLAARNVLVFENLTLKITDFGLTKYLEDKSYYRVCNHTLLPVKWMAPECIQFKKFTHMSDVWSYGIVVWEICSHGETPYSHVLEQGELLRRLVAGCVLEPPLDSPTILKTLMERTWHLDPARRPTFKTIFQQLTSFIKIEKESSAHESVNSCQKFETFERTN